MTKITFYFKKIPFPLHHPIPRCGGYHTHRFSCQFSISGDPPSSPSALDGEAKLVALVVVNPMSPLHVSSITRALSPLRPAPGTTVLRWVAQTHPPSPDPQPRPLYPRIGDIAVGGGGAEDKGMHMVWVG